MQNTILGYPLSADDDLGMSNNMIPNYLINYSSVLYLTDNYSGGELYFPRI